MEYSLKRMLCFADCELTIAFIWTYREKFRPLTVILREHRRQVTVPETWY